MENVILVISIVSGVLAIIISIDKILGKHWRAGNELKKEIVETIAIVKEYEKNQPERIKFVQETKECIADYKKHTLDASHVSASILLNQKALLAMLRNTITHVATKAIEANKIDFYEYENLEALFTAYESLHGNSYVHNLMIDVRKLEKIKTR